MINDLWYKNAIIYCLSVGSFMDANGDGVGDFPGLMRRAGLPAGPGRHRDLADAVSALAEARRRL
jgi:maltose alpha-D-glucosyltransferase/alpha-amylase